MSEGSGTRSQSDPVAELGTATDDGFGPLAATEPEVPAFIGKFAVLRRLGAGAMGEVFSGYDEDLDRRVAIKVLGEQRRSDSARMLREAQALARLSHPNVVQVYEVGRYESEIYIAMEFVQGETLRQWLHAERRSHHAILDVFDQAGRGLQAAHDAGLVHRDFKPDNVIVGGDGRVRVLDFGIARVDGSSRDSDSGDLDLDLEGSVERVDTSEKLTRTGQFMGTPAYMSPEQFQGHEVGARSDQFSFCVTLFEALYGRRPFDHSSVAALLQSVSSGDVGEVPANVEVRAEVVDAILRGLLPDPSQRWDSMRELLDALGYDESQDRRRRRTWWVAMAGVGTAAGLFAAQYEPAPKPCSGAGASLAEVWSTPRIDALERNAEGGLRQQSWAAARRSIELWTQRWTASFEDACLANLRREQSDIVLDRRMRCLQRRKAELDATLSVLEDAKADALAQASDVVAELPSADLCDDLDRLERMVEGPTDAAAAERVAVWRKELVQARSLFAAGLIEEADEALRKLEAESSELQYEPLLPEVLEVRARLLETLGEHQRATETLLEAYYSAVSSSHREFERQVAIDLVASLGLQQRRFADAESWIRLTEALLQRDGNPPEDRASLLLVLGGIREQQGRFDEAEALLVESLALHTKHEPDANAGPIHNALGLVHGKMGRPEDAEADYQRSMEIWIERGGPKHPQVAAAHNNLGTLHLHAGRYEEARASLGRALEIRLEVFGEASPAVGRSLNNLGSVAKDQGDLETATEHFEAALQTFQRAYGPDHPALAIVLNNLGDIALAQDDPSTARGHYERALEIDEVALGTDHRDLSYELIGLGRSALKLGEPDRAVEPLRRAVDLRVRHSFPTGDVAFARFHFGVALFASGQRREGVAVVDQAYEEGVGQTNLRASIERWRDETK